MEDMEKKRVEPIIWCGVYSSPASLQLLEGLRGDWGSWSPGAGGGGRAEKLASVPAPCLVEEWMLVPEENF